MASFSGEHSAHESNNDNDNTNDTFLSRVFGLHSIYNQLQDNYQYYDPEIDSLTYNNNLSVRHSHPHISRDTTDESHHESGHHEDEADDDDDMSPLLRPVEEATQSPPPNHLLDSESDSDLSSSDPEPLHSEQRVPPASSSPPAAQSSHRQRAHRHVSPSPFPASPIAPSDTNLENSPPKRTALKFNVPPVNQAKRFLLDKLNNRRHDSPLPVYNPPASHQQQFRKPQDQGPTPQTIYQRENKYRKQVIIPPRERALYLWANIVNMDEFLIDLYYYYRGKGLLNIVLGRCVSLVILVFILYFTIFLKWGINYDFFFNDWDSNSGQSITLADLTIPHFIIKRVPFSVKFLLFGFAGYIVLRLIQLYFDYNYKLKEIKNFYIHLIGIENDDELMTISWTTIVERLMALKDYNTLTSNNDNLPPHYLNDLNSKVRLNAHDIANRIMRKENYMIALINKEVLDLSIPIVSSNIPLLKSIFTTKSVLTKTLEWNLKLCINNFAFNNNGQLNNKILKEANRNKLAQELNSRFKMAAIINLLLCPFIVVYFVLLYFFRYFNEYKSNPSSILGLRQYTPWAEWKLREFNELPHFFIKRLHLSIGPANTYINQFPGGFLVINMMTLVNFISGAITAVLVIMGLWFEDEDHRFWSFELTTGKSTLFYISLFGTLWAVTSSSLQTSTGSDSSENLNHHSSSFFYDPEASLRYVSQFTHYLPSSWNGKLHTIQVKNEFCELYSLKILIIVNEIISLILTPFVLWFKISSSSGAIIDFFREYSIHVDGLGYVCSFAMFNFEEKDKNMMHDLNKRKRARKSLKHQKMKEHQQAKRTRKRSQKRKSIKDDVELESTVPQRHSRSNNRASASDGSSSSSSSSDESDISEYYQDDKMIKSYMYFLESYRGNGPKPPEPGHKNNMRRRQVNGNANGVFAANGLRNGAEAEAGPSPSIMFQKQPPPHSDPRVRAKGPNDASSHLSLTESAYNVNYRFNDDEEATMDDYGSDAEHDHAPSRTRIPRGNKGVLGMLNQFYRQDSTR